MAAGLGRGRCLRHPRSGDPRPPGQPKSYVLEMLPYPSGELHMGHVLNYTLGDVVSHVRRRKGCSVLRPMGYDAFGLPAENAAIREGGHPREVTERNIAAIREQIKRMGWSIDWTREISTHEPEYYRWTQWMFLKLLEAGLAYRRAAPVKWCPNDQTVLANEQVIDGRCERCGAEVESRNLEQWMFRITAYADRLLDDMALLESWPERVLTMQRNWIGRSEGAEVAFAIDGLDEHVEVFTTRPDTLFGATFFVLAPEHPLVETLRRALRRRARRSEPTYATRRAARARSARLRSRRPASSPASTPINPVNDEQIPIWVADYVLMDYGTGAIMAVPAHDERDFAFAERFGLPIVQVVAPARRRAGGEAAYVSHSDDDVLINSGQFDGLPRREAKRAIVAGSQPTAAASRRSTTACATGCFRASATGAARSRSCTARAAASWPCPTRSCRCCCPRSTTTCRRAARRSRPPKSG